MTEHWTLAPDATREEHDAFATLEQTFGLEGEPIARDPLSRVLRVSVGGKRYYVKRYTKPAKDPLRYWFARPRVQAEWENLQAFEAWGVPTARIVAQGLERRWGKFVRGAMITEEIRCTQDLADLAYQNDPRLKDREWVDNVSQQIADITRTLHEHRFTHNDLKWRNILVTDQTPPQVFLIDCPAGMVWFEPFLSYRKVKDLACLDKVAKQVLSRTQRLRFYLRYRQLPHLGKADKQQLRKILNFFKGRE